MISGVHWWSVPPGSGYGEASESYLRGLHAAGVAVAWTPLGWPSPRWRAPHGPIDAAWVAGAPLAHLVDREIAHDVVVVSSTPLWHPELRRAATGRRLVAYTTWECDRLPADHVAILNRYDRVLVPSRFNAHVFAASGVSAELRVVPHISRIASAPRRRPAAGARFVFYAIGTWSARKAIRDLVEAYLTAFTATEPVELRIHTTPDDMTAIARLREGDNRATASSHVALARLLSGRARVPAIRLSAASLGRAEVDALHHAGDCFVLLSRGEGWGLGAFEAAAAGRPVIVTGWGGTPEFLPEGYPYLVDYELVDAASEPDAWLVPPHGARWARASVEHAAALMRRVYEEREDAWRWGARAQEAIARAYAEPSVTRQLIAALSQDGAATANRA